MADLTRCRMLGIQNFCRKNVTVLSNPECRWISWACSIISLVYTTKCVISTGLQLRLRRRFGFMVCWLGLWLGIGKESRCVGKFSALLMIELPASITFNSLRRHFHRSDKDQFDDPCSLAMFFLTTSGIFVKIKGTSNAPYELSI